MYYPGRIGPGAMFIALLSAAMARSSSRLPPFAVALTTASWFAGMVIAVLLEKPIF